MITGVAGGGGALLQGSQVSPVRPFDMGSTEAKTVVGQKQWLEKEFCVELYDLWGGKNLILVASTAIEPKSDKFISGGPHDKHAVATRELSQLLHGDRGKPREFL